VGGIAIERRHRNCPINEYQSSIFGRLNISGDVDRACLSGRGTIYQWYSLLARAVASTSFGVSVAPQLY
jgi:hypothetical protein